MFLVVLDQTLGIFFYKRKLSVYNLTAHCSKNRKAYNAVWGEHIAGRGANEIASALCRILKDIINEYPETEDLVLWYIPVYHKIGILL